MRCSFISNLTAAAILATACSALAQQLSPGTSQPPAANQAPMMAPIGHRQPRMSDLPPAVAEEERSGEQSPATEPTGSGARRSRQDDLIDERLRICRGC
jgi:hypothetical protein